MRSAIRPGKRGGDGTDDKPDGDSGTQGRLRETQLLFDLNSQTTDHEEGEDYQHQRARDHDHPHDR